MKQLLAIAMALGIMIIPYVAYAFTGQVGPVDTQPEQTATKAPPVSQQLVPEGDFALKLATALKLGTPETEAQVEDMLALVGIAPKNGWIADYPMTPIIIDQVRNAVITATALNKLPMGKDEALQAFDGLTAEFGIASEADALVSQKRYSTLTGTAVRIQGGLRKWLDVKRDKDEVVVNFRIGRKTVYIPHRYPYIGEKVKVEYLTNRGVNVAYTVTILGQSKESSK